MAKSIRKKTDKKRSLGSKSFNNETNTSSSHDAKQILILAAKRLFARKGLTGTSIRDIAQEAGLNSSLISYYFSGKDGLYKSCLENIISTRFKFTQALLTAPQSKEEFKLRLKLFAENFFQVFLEDQEAGLIFVREYDRVHSPAEQVFKTNFLKLIESIAHFFKHAQKEKIISKMIDPFILANLFFGSLFSYLRLDHYLEKTFQRTIKSDKERNNVICQIVELFG